MTNTLPVDLEILTQETIGGFKIETAAQQEAMLNLLIYGDSGVGKTRLAGSADAVEAMSPVLMVDVDGGGYTLKSCYPAVKIVRVKRFVDLQKVYDDLLRGRHNYRTVVLDSLSELQQFSMTDIMKEVVDKDSDRDPDVPAQRDWGKNQVQIRRFVRAFRDLPMHTVFVAHEKERQDPRTKAVSLRPSLPGKLSGEVAGFVDFVLHYSSRYTEGDNVRALQSLKTEKILAKDRSNRLPEIMPDPTMKTIFDAINQTPEPEKENENAS